MMRREAGWWPAPRVEAWLKKMGFTDSDAARALGCQRMTIAKYKANGAPLFIGLAARAIAEGRKPY